MAEQKARLRIVAKMTEPDGQVHETKNARVGTFEEKNGEITLSYDDVQEGDRAHVVLTAQKNGAQMRRLGEMTGVLRFEPGKRTSGVYTMIYGEIPVAVYTRRVQLTRQETGGELRLDYDVFVSGEKTSSADMTVTWRV